MSDLDEDKITELAELASKALDARAKEALAVFVYKGVHLFLHDIHLNDDGKLGIDYSTFPVLKSDVIEEVEMFIKEQICN